MLSFHCSKVLGTTSVPSCFQDCTSIVNGWLRQGIGFKVSILRPFEPPLSARLVSWGVGIWKLWVFEFLKRFVYSFFILLHCFSFGVGAPAVLLDYRLRWAPLHALCRWYRGTLEQSCLLPVGFRPGLAGKCFVVKAMQFTVKGRHFIVKTGWVAQLLCFLAGFLCQQGRSILVIIPLVPSRLQR